MLKQYHQTVGGVFRLTDSVVVAGVWLLSYWLRFHVPIFEVTKGFPKFHVYAALTPLLVAVWLVVFSWMEIYQPKRMLRRTHEAHLVLKGHATALLLFLGMTYFISEYRYSRGVILYFGALAAFGLVYSRLLIRNLIRSARSQGYKTQKVLAVGEGASIETLASRIAQFPELGLRLIGVITQAGSQAQSVAGRPVLGHFENLVQVIHQEKVERVLIALPRQQYAETDRILESLREETVDIQIVPDLHEYVTLGCEVEDFDGLPIVNLNDSPLIGWGAWFKRATDFALSFVALTILSPVLILISIAVKLTSRGPILYKQQRMGMDGFCFDMIKFRSMRVDAENAGAVWAKPGDDRRTPIGAFLRATSLDELPQLWNVLKGDMSLVGPRPERPVFVHQFKSQIPGYMLRHKVKAGITGWAQINGWRGNTSLESRIECDLYYIRNWSYTLDWKILLLTFWKGFVNKNAY